MGTVKVIATSQGIEHFRNMKRLQYTTSGGAVSETVTIGDVTLSAKDYIRIISDPNTNVLGARIIEIKASRNTSNGTILIGSCDGTTNMPGNLSLEIIIIRRQTDGQAQGASEGFGNPADSFWGHLDESASDAFNVRVLTFDDVNVHSLLTADSIVWVDQKQTLASMPSGIIELFSSRIPGTSFRVGKANSTENPAAGNMNFDWAVLNP